MIWIVIGLIAVVALALVVVIVLDDVAENHEGPGAAPYDSPSGDL